MKALCWNGKDDVRVERVPDPEILNPRDAIVQVTSTAICGSDLHLYDGFIPTMKPGDILGHEFMGEVVEVGAGSDRPRRSATAWWCRSPSPAAAASSASGSCGRCATTPIPNAWMAGEALRLLAVRPVRLLAHVRRLRRRPGRVRRACRSPTSGRSKFPTRSTDEQVLFLSDIFPTGYMAAENCNIQPRRHRRGLGLRAGRAVRDPERVSARRRARHRDRPRAGAPRAGARRQASAETINYER